MWAWDALCGMVQNVDPVHSVIFTHVFLAPAGPEVKQVEATEPHINTMEGLGWKQEPGVSGFVALSNLSGQAVRATIQVSSNDSKVIGNHAVNVSPHGTKMVALQELLQAGGLGGLNLSYDGPEGGLVVSGGLQDPVTGYSASLKFAPSVDPSAPGCITTADTTGDGQAYPVVFICRPIFVLDMSIRFLYSRWH